MTWNFCFNRRLTFTYSRHDAVLPQYVRFVATSTAGALISWSVSAGLVRGNELFYDHPFWTLLAAICTGTFSNFLVSFGRVFRRARHDSSEIPPETIRNTEMRV
jgi:putative flippase GtrA